MKSLVLITGPTATGKTPLSVSLAKTLNTVIISADSRQMYREMKIGTAVPSSEELKTVQHFFIGSLSIHDYYNASLYETEVNSLLETLFKKYDRVLIVGGSGLYIDSVCKGIDDFPSIDPLLRERLMNQYKTEGIEGLRSTLKMLDPEYYEKADLRNYKRILKALEVSLMTGKPYSTFLSGKRKVRDYKIIQIGLELPREELYNRIDSRVDRMLEHGLEKEARSLLAHKGSNALNTVGYRELFDYFEGKISREEAIRLIKRNTRRYAKRQISWFSRDKEIQWFHPEEKLKIENFIRKETESRV
jgi:tRNA dimethylallyltransferase